MEILFAALHKQM